MHSGKVGLRCRLGWEEWASQIVISWSGAKVIIFSNFAICFGKTFQILISTIFPQKFAPSNKPYRVQHARTVRTKKRYRTAASVLQRALSLGVKGCDVLAVLQKESQLLRDSIEGTRKFLRWCPGL
jgi:hypothetical protein